MPLVSIAGLRVRSWRYLPEFLSESFHAARQAGAATGSLPIFRRSRHLPVNPVSGTGEPGAPPKSRRLAKYAEPGQVSVVESLRGFAPGAGNS